MKLQKKFSGGEIIGAGVHSKTRSGVPSDTGYRFAVRGRRLAAAGFMLVIWVGIFVAAAFPAFAGSGSSVSGPPHESEFSEFAEFEEFDTDSGPEVFDPLRGYNRVMTRFNDRLYFWVLKPAAQA